MNLTESRLLQIIREEVVYHEHNKTDLAIANLVIEGIYDPGILKCVFMAGGPGSGKSYTAGEIFGGSSIKDAANQASTALGLRIINSDPAFEMYLKKAGVSPSDLSGLPDDEFKALTEPADSPRGKASKMKKSQQKVTEIGRLGMIIDGTGDDFGKIIKKKEAVEALGYDTMMVFVNTTLEMAQERNINRDRKLPADLVESIWTSVQENLEKYQSLFSNFQIIDNTEYAWSESEQKAASAAVRFVKSPIQNAVGRQWVQDALTAKGADASDPWVQQQTAKILG